MIYPENYLDGCNGLIPQIVLSIMLLQGGNQRTRQYANAFRLDVSDTTNWTLDGIEAPLLSLSGYLPLMEARYLLDTASIVERIGAMNDTNIELLQDSVGVPIAAFDDHLALKEVELPTGINHLSSNELILEKRLAWMLLHLKKRNHLISLCNALYYFKQFAVQNRYYLSNNTYIPYPDKVISITMLNSLFYNLFLLYPTLEKIIFGGRSDITTDRLATASTWVQSQLESDNPKLIPFIEPLNLESAITEVIKFITQVTVNPGQTVFVTAGEDVTSEITSTGLDGSSDVESIPAFTRSNDSGTESPFTQAPSPVFEPPTNDTPINSLPDC